MVRCAGLLSAVLVAAPASAELLSTTTQSPLLASVQLPAPLPTHIEATTTTSGVLNWGSNALVQVRGDDQLVIDSETREFRLSLVRGFNDRFAVKIDIPYYQQEDGTLDSFIDDWHKWTGLPDGDRPLLERDQLQLFYRDDGELYLNSRESSSGLGDIGLSFGMQLSERERSKVSAWLSINLPTSTNDLYTLADDATEASLTLALEQALGARWHFYAQGSVTTAFGDDFISDQADVIWSGHAGVEFGLTRRIGLLAQLQAHTALVPDSKLEILGESVVATIGGNVHTDSGWTFQLGLSEDIAVEASPDVVFVFGFGKRWD